MGVVMYPQFRGSLVDCFSEIQCHCGVCWVVVDTVQLEARHAAPSTGCDRHHGLAV